MKSFTIHKNATIQEVTKGKHHFFGFHDLCPWDESERYILAMETDFIDRPPKAGDVARICLVDTRRNNELRVLGETRAWNFQQGARLQWVPGEKNNIMYNDQKEDGKLISMICDIETSEKRNLNYPIYAISPSGDFGLGLDFRSLVGGYAYRTFRGEREKNTGIVNVDLKTGEEKLIILTSDVAKLDHSPTPNEHHALTQIAFNPSGTRICFMDKYRLPDGGFMQRLITANPDGSDPYVLPGHITHYDWRNDTEILGYGKFTPLIMDMRNKGVLKNPLLKPFLGIVRNMRGIVKQKIAGQSYLLLRDTSKEVKRIAVGCMTEDGHPQFSPDGKWVITDTYPNKNHEQTLILYDWNKKKRMNVATFKSLPQGLPESWDESEMRSDLHPRWNRSGTKVCVDSTDGKTRQIYSIEVRNLLHKDNIY